MIDKHIYFSAEDILKIKSYSRKKNMTFTSAVRELIKLSLDNEDILERISLLDKDIKKCYYSLNNIVMLLEQLYSDMNFDNITNPKQSKQLNKFKKKLNLRRYDD